MSATGASHAATANASRPHFGGTSHWYPSRFCQLFLSEVHRQVSGKQPGSKKSLYTVGARLQDRLRRSLALEIGHTHCKYFRSFIFQAFQKSIDLGLKLQS